MTNMFDLETPADPVEAIKAKYNGNPDEAWKALAHSQKHIQTLEAEAQERTKAKTLEEVLQELKQSQQVTPQSQAPTSAPVQSVLDETELETKLDKMLRKKAEEERIKQAKEVVATTLVRQYGSVEKAKEMMQTKSKELGMSVEALDTIGLNSPQALFKLFGIDSNQRPSVNASPTMGTVRTNMTEQPQVDVMAKYRDLLKTDRNKYYSQEVQNAIMAEAMRQAGL